MIRIREADQADVDVLVDIIRTANQVVADQLGLTLDNAPTHPSNCQPDWIKRDFSRGITYYILEGDDYPIGCVAFEQSENRVCYLERLAVRPSDQKQGYGSQLVEFFFTKAKALDNKKVSVAMIQEHESLLRWYRKLGFVETSFKRFEHLPFTVQFLEYPL